MKLVQFVIPEKGRRLGSLEQDIIIDITSQNNKISSVYEAFIESKKINSSIDDYLNNSINKNCHKYNFFDLHTNEYGSKSPYLLPSFDRNDPNRLLISGTGLTHLGSMKSRDSMHTEEKSNKSIPLTDSAKMFQMGLEGGKPIKNERGISPEWFYKGNGNILKGHRQNLDIPSFALDGGEEPEIAACYIIDQDGNPCRIGFTIGNEWSDHETEKINYLYLAPSKLRQCSIGPELITDLEFNDLTISCEIYRDDKNLYKSGDILSGENNMSHSLGNCEDHHFKYPQHRIPGDSHIHFFGTIKLSFTERDWNFQDGDQIKISSDKFTAPLINGVAKKDTKQNPIEITKA